MGRLEVRASPATLALLELLPPCPRPLSPQVIALEFELCIPERALVYPLPPGLVVITRHASFIGPP